MVLYDYALYLPSLRFRRQKQITPLAFSLLICADPPSRATISVKEPPTAAHLYVLICLPSLAFSLLICTHPPQPSRLLSAGAAPPLRTFTLSSAYLLALIYLPSLSFLRTFALFSTYLCALNYVPSLAFPLLICADPPQPCHHLSEGAAPPQRTFTLSSAYLLGLVYTASLQILLMICTNH